MSATPQRNLTMREFMMRMNDALVRDIDADDVRTFIHDDVTRETEFRDAVRDAEYIAREERGRGGD